jgi:transposase
MEAGMGRALAIRRDFTAAELRRLARQSQDADQTRRLLALAVIYDGGSRGEAAETGGVGRQILRDWVERFNAEGPAGLIGRKPPGNRPKLDDAQRAALVRVVESGPNPVRDGVVRWRLIDLAAWVWDKFGISVSAATLSRELNALGFGKLSAPDPISQRGAVKVDLLPSVDFRLSVERQMIAIFADQHMGQRPWTGAPPVDGATGQGGLGERLTARAGSPAPGFAETPLTAY